LEQISAHTYAPFWLIPAESLSQFLQPYEIHQSPEPVPIPSRTATPFPHDVPRASSTPELTLHQYSPPPPDYAPHSPSIDQIVNLATEGPHAQAVHIFEVPVSHTTNGFALHPPTASAPIIIQSDPTSDSLMTEPSSVDSGYEVRHLMYLLP